MLSYLRGKLKSLHDRLQRPLLCSNCFNDYGLAAEARSIGKQSSSKCPHCGTLSGGKLDRRAVDELVRNFFINGSYVKTEYGGATILRFGNGDVEFPSWLKPDVRLLSEAAGIGLQYHGPALWRLGGIEPLKALQTVESRQSAAEDVVRRFPRRKFAKGEAFYRLRKNIIFGKACEAAQYDAPPVSDTRDGRLNDIDFPILYGSQDVEICVHECRVTKADECYLATLRNARNLDLLDLCAEIESDGPTPFESWYLAVQFVFSAEEHSYDVARAIAKAAKSAGLDGIAYPSYFSSLRGGKIPNLGLFGHPIEDRAVEFCCADRLNLKAARYVLGFGPCLPQ
jgi:RES domain